MSTELLEGESQFGDLETPTIIRKALFRREELEEDEIKRAMAEDSKVEELEK